MRIMSELADYRYFYLFCRTKYFSKKLSDKTKGANYPAVSEKDVFDFPIPLPPLLTQHKIVEILEETDNLRKLRRQADEKMKDLIPSLFVQMFGDPATNPKGWQMRLLSDVILFQEGPGIRNWQFTNEGIKLLNVKNIVNGVLDLTNTDRFLSYTEVEKTYKHFLAEAGDLVMASSGVTWGKTAWVHDQHLPLCMNTSTIRFKPKDKNVIDRQYMRYIFDSGFFKDQIRKIITGAAQPNFGPLHLRQVKMLLPPLGLQQQFARLVEEIEAEKTRQAESRRKLDELFFSLMQRAFTGELVA